LEASHVNKTNTCNPQMKWAWHYVVARW